MTPQKKLIILNPVAGKGSAGRRRLEIEALLNGRSIAYDLVLTKGARYAAELARDAGKKGYGAVVAAGGDGTVNEVINGLMSADAGDGWSPVMGALALGRGNDFAYGADIPQDLRAGVDVIAAGKTRFLDVGLITGGDYQEGLFFGNGVGIGFDTIVGLEDLPQISRSPLRPPWVSRHRHRTGKPPIIHHEWKAHGGHFFHGPRRPQP